MAFLRGQATARTTPNPHSGRWIVSGGGELAIANQAPAPTDGAAYDFTYTGVNGLLPYVWSMDAPGIAELTAIGLTWTAGTATIAGTVTGAVGATATYTVTLTDANGDTAQVTQTLTVQAAIEFGILTEENPLDFLATEENVADLVLQEEAA